MTDGNDTHGAATTGDGAHVRASALIERFGGIRPMATKLGLAVSTVQGWKQRDSIPATRLPLIRTAAAEHRISLIDDELAPIGASPDMAAARAPPQSRPHLRSPAARASWVLPTLALVVAIAAIAYATWLGARLQGGDTASAAELDARVAALEQSVVESVGANSTRLDGLEQRAEGLATRLQELALAPRPPPDAEARLQRLEGALPTITAQVASVAERPAQITARLAEIEDGLNALAQRQTGQADAAQAADAQSTATLNILRQNVDALRADIDALGAVAHGADAATVSAVGLAMAAGQLRAAVAATRPFEEALASVRALATGDTALADSLAPLEAAAATGIADLATLRQRFATVARDVVAAERGEDDRNWVDRTLSRAASLVSVRRVGADVPGDGAEAVVARAEMALERADIATAIGELAHLEGAGADAAGNWLKAARAHIAAEQALIELDEAVRAALAAAG